MTEQRILLLDDEAFFRSLCRSALRAAGYHNVYEADTVATAQAMVYTVDPQVVLCDIRFPDGQPNGLAFLGWLRQSCPTIRILMVTAEATAKTVSAANAYKPDGYVLKPVSPATLRRRIEQVTAG